MSGKPCGCVGKPKQDPDWRAESTEGHLLPQSWVVAAVCGHGLKTVPVTNCYNKIKKRDSGTKTALTVFVSLLTQAWFLRRIQVCPSEIWTARACQFRSCSYLVIFACEDSSVVHTMLALAFVHRHSQPMSASRRGGTGRGNAGASWECTAQVQSLRTKKQKKTLAGQPGLTTSKFLWGQTRCTQSYAGPTGSATRQLNRVYLIKLFHAFLLVKTQLSIFKHFVGEMISWISSVCIEVIWSKRFFKKTRVNSRWKSSYVRQFVRRTSKDIVSLCTDLNQSSVRWSPKEPLFFMT